MKTMIAAVMIAAPLISQCWIVGQELDFIEEHNLQRVKVSCYIAPEGAHTADGSLCYEGIVASNKAHLGMDCIVYDDDLVAVMRLECRDVGGHPMLQNGTAIDIYRDNMDRAWQLVGEYGTHVWVEWIEREDQTNDGKHQTNGQAVRPAAENPKSLR